MNETAEPTRWWRQLLIDVMAPGATMLRRRRMLALAALAVGTALPVAVGLYAVLSGRNWVALSLDRGFLGWLLVALIGAAVVRVAAVGVWLRSGEMSRQRVVAGTAAAIGCAVALGWGAVAVGQARADIADVFTTADGEQPLFDASAEPVADGSDGADTGIERVEEVIGAPVTTLPHGEAGRPNRTTTTTTEVRQLPTRPISGVSPDAVANVRNILLLGGDAGPGRSGLRTDTMMVLSLDTVSGRAGLVSLPRDMKGLLFPPGSELERRYPYGFDELANAVYPIVQSNSSLRAAYDVGDIRPGIYALAQAIGYSLDVTIHDYVLIDMQGFVDLIDALGGVTVEVAKQLPMPGNIPGADADYPATIGPGTVEMNGTIALGYVRSRYADSDYQRTARQRKLIAALARQVSMRDVLLRYGEVSAAVGDALRTSLTPDELANTIALIGGETAIVESVGLVPPLTSMTRPDFQKLAEVVGAVRLAVATGQPSGY